MAESTALRIWSMRLLFLSLSLGVMFFQLMPLDIAPGGPVGPDLLIVLPMAWALRRAEYVPALLVATVMLLADLLFDRPPGLLAFFTVLAVEALKTRATQMREQTVLAEWLSVALVLTAIMVANRLVLAVLLVPQPPLGLTLLQLAATVAAYPAVLAASHFVFGVRKVHPGDLDAIGGNA